MRGTRAIEGNNSFPGIRTGNGRIMKRQLVHIVWSLAKVQGGAERARGPQAAQSAPPRPALPCPAAPTPVRPWRWTEALHAASARPRKRPRPGPRVARSIGCQMKSLEIHANKQAVQCQAHIQQAPALAQEQHLMPPSTPPAHASSHDEIAACWKG